MKPAILPFGWLLLVVSPVLGQFTYTTNNGTLTITGYTGTNANVVIPDTITGLPVTAIGDSAFWRNTSLTSVTIPNGVTDIGIEAFGGCTSLTTVSIPNGVTSIEGETGDALGAFESCISLTNVIIPNTVTNIGVGAFGG
jgi:hypothetical protein